MHCCLREECRTVSACTLCIAQRQVLSCEDKGCLPAAGMLYRKSKLLVLNNISLLLVWFCNYEISLSICNVVSCLS